MCARAREREMKRILFFFSSSSSSCCCLSYSSHLCACFISQHLMLTVLSRSHSIASSSLTFSPLFLFCVSLFLPRYSNVYSFSRFLSLSLSLSHVTIYTIIKMLRGGRERKKKRKTNQTSPHYTR